MTRMNKLLTQPIAILLLVCIVFLLFFSLGQTTHAQEQTWENVTVKSFSEAVRGTQTTGKCNDPDPAVRDPMCADMYLYWGQQTTFAVGGGMIMGIPDTSEFDFEVYTNPRHSDFAKAYDKQLDGSALGFLTDSIISMYGNPPASGAYYARHVLENAGLAEPAHAQGVGYSGLKPLLPLWTTFRNISYLILVIILVAVGFMIMFRMKINAQTAITIQTALPNIIITLIVITFSYAIAGLLIDLMYLLMGLIISVLFENGILAHLGLTVDEIRGQYLNSNIGTLFGSVVGTKTMFALPGALAFQPWNMLGTVAKIFVAPAIFAAALGASLGVVAWLLIALALLFTFVRLFVMFLNSYIQIVLSIVFAPIILLVGALPGRNAFRNWFMGLMGHLIIFPAAMLLFMLANYLSYVTLSKTGPASGALWSPPFVAGPTGSSENVLSGLIGLGMMMLTPSILKTIKGAFEPKPVLPITPGVLFRPIMGAQQTIMQLGQSKMYMKELPGVKNLMPK